MEKSHPESSFSVQLKLEQPQEKAAMGSVDVFALWPQISELHRNASCAFGNEIVVDCNLTKIQIGRWTGNGSETNL